MSIAIVTDSTCDIPHHMVKDKGIYVVPNIIVIDGNSVEDNEEFSREDFYNRLPDMPNPPTTATASPGTYERLYSQLLHRGFDYIISLHASRKLSGIYNAASIAAQSFGECVKVIDSRQVSLAMGFQVLAAREAVVQGLSMSEIIDLINDIQRRARLFAMLDTLTYVRRSGRISWMRAGLGSLLNIKLFVEVKDGIVRKMGEVRTRSKGIIHLLDLLNKQGPLERLAVLHTNAENELAQLLTHIQTQLTTSPIIVNVTTVIGAHVGPNGLGFAFIVAN